MPRREQSSGGRLPRTRPTVAHPVSGRVGDGKAPLVVAGQAIGPGRPVFVIAEAGVNHDGSPARALELAKRPENAGKTMVVIIPSFAERYLSTALFEGLGG